MEIESRRKNQVVSFVIVLAFLLLMAGGLVVLIMITLQEGRLRYAEDPKLARTLFRLAWVSVAMLGLTSVMLFWAVIHFLVRRMGPHPHEPTEYVNAWTLAGQRAKPVDEGDENTDEERS